MGNRSRNGAGELKLIRLIFTKRDGKYGVVAIRECLD
jgi:hypothetical protein